MFQIDISDADCFIYDSTRKYIYSQATLALNGGNAIFFLSFLRNHQFRPSGVLPNHVYYRQDGGAEREIHKSS